MKKAGQISPYFESLTWEQLEGWAGHENVVQGRERQYSVQSLRSTPEGGLLGTVAYSGNSTLIWFDKAGHLSSECTCSAGAKCQHAVSVVLYALDVLSHKKGIPLAEEDDARYQMLDDCTEGRKDPSESQKNWYWPYSYYLETEKDLEETPREGRPYRDEVELFLQTLSKAEQFEARTFLEEHPEERKEVEKQVQPELGTNEEIEEGARTEFQRIRDQFTWVDVWGGKEEQFNLGIVELHLVWMLRRGMYKEIMALALELKTECESIYRMHLLEFKHMEWELRGCFCIAIEALEKSPLSEAQKLYWEASFRGLDPYHFLSHVPTLWEKPEAFQAAAWESVGERLDSQFQRLKDSCPFPPSALYLALTFAGHREEAFRRVMQLLKTPEDYLRIAKDLWRYHQCEEAILWCQKGIPLAERWYECRGELARFLRQLYQKKGASLHRIAMQCEVFFRTCEFREFETLQTQCEKERIWEAVEPHLLRYLETGERPAVDAGWPLPHPGFEWIYQDWDPFPLYPILAKIAFHEDRIEDALTYIRIAREEKRSIDESIAIKIAERCATTHTQDAIAIYTDLVWNACGLLRLQFFESACRHLRRLYGLHDSIDCMEEWFDLVNAIRTRYKTRTRLLKLLDELMELLVLPKGIILRKPR